MAIINLSSTTPAAGTGSINVVFTYDANNNVSGSIPAPLSAAAASLTEVTSSVLTITGGAAAVLNATTIQVAKATATTSGYLSSADWTAFNSGAGGAASSLQKANNLSDVASAAAARTNLGLGSSAVLAAGAASGVATLNSGGTLTAAQIPASLTGAVVYQGTWNASANTPALASGTGTKGFYYKVSVPGTTAIDGNSSWNLGDTIIFDGTTWDKIDGQAVEVLTVFGRSGAVVAAAGDYTPAQVGLGNVGNALQLTAANNLSDLANAGTARTNLGLTAAAIATLPLAIANGGTGQITAGAALTALGAAASGANSSITSLSGLTTPLSVAQGGSGTATPALVAGTNITLSGSWPNVTINAASTASLAFSALVSSTNTAAAMIVGSGASLAVSGSGTIAATSVLAAGVPTLNQSTTGTAANVTGVVAIANGGTGQTTAAAALTALGGATSASLSGYASLSAANTFTGVQTISVSGTNFPFVIAASGATVAGVQLVANSTNFYLQNRGSLDTPNNRFAIYGTAEWVTVLTGGNVGIGNSNPGSLFTVGANLFTVAATSGNTAVAGTLAVTGAATFTVAPVFTNAAGTRTALGLTAAATATPAALTDATSPSVLTITGGSAALLAATSITVAKATGSVAGYLAAADWTAFNAKQAALGYTPLNPANNLSDVANAGTAFTNLGGASLSAANTFTAAQTMSSTLAVTGAATLSSTLSVAGAATFNGSFTVNNQASTTGSVAGWEFLDRTTSLPWVLYATGGNAYIYNNTLGAALTINAAGAIGTVGALSVAGLGSFPNGISITGNNGGWANSTIGADTSSLIINPPFGAIYLCYSRGNAGVNFCNGSSGIVASVSATGVGNFASVTTSTMNALTWFSAGVWFNGTGGHVRGVAGSYLVINSAGSQPLYFNLDTGNAVACYGPFSCNGTITAAGAASFASLTLSAPLPIASGGTGTTVAGVNGTIAIMHTATLSGTLTFTNGIVTHNT